MSLGWFKKKEGVPIRPPKAANPRPPGNVPKPGGGISGLLSEDLIVISPPKLGKEKLIELLVRKLCERRSLGKPGPFLDKVLEREQGVSTTLDTGLAVPHARVDGLPSVAAILGLIPQGLPDPKQPDLMIRVMFLFLSPNRQEVFTEHLHLLRGVSTLFQTPFIESILKAPTPAAALEFIRSKEASSA